VTPGRRAVAVAAMLVVAGCGGRQGGREVVVGSTPEAESVVLAELYAGALRSYGKPARVESAADPLTKLDTGAYEVVPGFTGRLLQRFQPGAAAVSEEQVYRAMVAALPEGVAAGDYTPSAEDTPTAAVTDATATAWGRHELSAFVRHCPQLTLGKPARADVPSHVGPCAPPPAREFADDTALFDALRGGQINAAWTTTADPDVPSGVVVLANRQPPLLAAENVVPLYRRNELGEREVLALNEVAGEFDTAALADMRRQVGNGANPREVAEAWLAAHPLGR
jgi:glycine betaine/choline ABC-type transport system substrate-binding protein